MIIATRLKLRPTHCLWFLLIGIIIIRTERASAHAPPRAMYYGHRVEPREPFQHIPSSLFYGSQSRDRSLDIPSCSQLRYMWKSSIKELLDITNNNNNDNLDTNEIPMILSNPYYTTLLWQQQMLQRKPSFGKIEVEPTTSSQDSPNQNRVQLQHHDKTSPKQVTPIPGRFMDKPSQTKVVYGRVLHSPDEAQETHQISNTDSKHHRSRENGHFGSFDVPQVYDINESNGGSTEINGHNNEKNSAKKLEKGSGSFSSAEEFFKSGIWHDKPVIPSVSLQHYH